MVRREIVWGIGRQEITREPVPIYPAPEIITTPKLGVRKTEGIPRNGQ
jgi:hypothetical protein